MFEIWDESEDESEDDESQACIVGVLSPKDSSQLTSESTTADDLASAFRIALLAIYLSFVDILKHLWNYSSNEKESEYYKDASLSSFSF